MIMKWQLILAVMAGKITEEQRDLNQYLIAENKVLLQKLESLLNGRRLLISNAQRRRLAAAARKVKRKVLKKIDTAFSPNTLYKWFNTLIAQKYDGSTSRKLGRPKTMKTIRELILKMAGKNPTWGYTRIRDALNNLGYNVCRTTVQRILNANGIEPAPERNKSMTWHEFLRLHWGMIAATDFFNVEIFTPAGLKRYSVLFFIDLKSRMVEIAGITEDPYEAWMNQMARNVTDCVDGFLIGKQFLILDRDPLFSKKYRKLIESADVTPLRLPRRSPDLNSIAERFVKSIKSESLSRIIIFGEDNLRRIIREYVNHYHKERNHQGLNNRLIIEPSEFPVSGEIKCKKRLNGLLNYYYRDAA